MSLSNCLFSGRYGDICSSFSITYSTSWLKLSHLEAPRGRGSCNHLGSLPPPLVFPALRERLLHASLSLSLTSSFCASLMQLPLLFANLSPGNQNYYFSRSCMAWLLRPPLFSRPYCTWFLKLLFYSSYKRHSVQNSPYFTSHIWRAWCSFLSYGVMCRTRAMQTFAVL